ncbi:MAG TPA: SPOR domain-containing protein [Paludibacter sp.]|nr:SPOR domain-containing protein [Paludibacter sp.]
MKKTLRFMLVMSVILVAATSCKTKQKVARIPGANIPATTEQPAKQVVSEDAPVVSAPVNEVTRNENFKLAEGETNADVFKYKYHVVVGSFSKQTNAKGLQATLNSEGNRAVVVVNENGMFRVLLASFNDYVQAHAKISSVSSRFPDAWVLVQK